MTLRKPLNAILAIALTLLCTGSAVAQAKTVTDPAAHFAQPPAVERPWVYWFWKNGNISKEGITADLEAMAAQGIGGAIMMEVKLSVPDGPVKFFDAQWRELFKFAVSEASRLGLQLDMNSAPGWTGSGGAWVTPEQSMKMVVASEATVQGPAHAEIVLPKPETRCDFYRDIAVLAFPAPAAGARIAAIDEKALYKRGAYSSQPGVRPAFAGKADYDAIPPEAIVDAAKIADLSGRMNADGKLNWDAPEGAWTVMRFGYTSTGQTNRPAPLPGLECDKMDPAALDAHFRDFTEQLVRDVGSYAGRTLMGTHLDSWEVGGQNWTARFREEFQQRRGYDLLPYLPAMTGRVVGSSEKSERFLWDLRETVSEMIAQYHGEHMAELAKKLGLELSIEPYDMTPCDDMSLGAAATIPMCEFWSNVFDSRYSVTEATSIGHVYGRNEIAAEAFTSIDKWLLHPGAIKTNGDWAFSEGVNHMVVHRYIHQPFPNAKPGLSLGPHGLHYERTQTWWDFSKPWHEYLARCQYMLKLGRPVADVLYLSPEGAPNVFQRPQPAPDGYKFDACTPAALMKRVRAENGRMVLPEGGEYRLLVLPNSETMTPELLETVKKLADAGVPVLGMAPKASPSLANYPACDERVRRLAQAAWSGPHAIVGYEKPAAAQTPEDGLDRARWIWRNEGQPQIAAPPERRCFRRVIEVGDGLRSAMVWMTADNSYQLVVNGERTADGANFNQIGCSDITAKLKPGLNNLLVVASNSDKQANPAGLIGSVALRYADGHTDFVVTDKQWRVVPRKYEFDTSTSDAGAGEEALELGTLGMAPWNTPEKAMPKTNYYPESDRVVAMLQQLGVQPDFESRTGLRFSHRTNGGLDVYFVSNGTDHAVSEDCVFKSSGKAPQLWHPETGEMRALPQYQATPDGRTVVPLRLGPAESYFVVFAKDMPKTDGANFGDTVDALTVAGTWNVSFDPKLGGPAQAQTFSALNDWAARPEEGIQHYSGKAVYTTQFDCPAELAESPARRYLDLGRVEVVASVKVNGKPAGIAWRSPYRVEVTGLLQAGKNTLEVTVANLWVNRMIGDEALPPDSDRNPDGTLKAWPQWLLEGKSSPTGRVTFATWRHWAQGDPLQPSGLLGPVKVLAVSK